MSNNYLFTFEYMDGAKTVKINVYSAIDKLTRGSIESVVNFVKREEKTENVVVLNIIKLEVDK